MNSNFYIAQQMWTLDQGYFPAVGFLGGIILVIVYGVRYFGETKIALDSDQTEDAELLPFTARASTVRGRFIFWQLAFCVSLVAIYLSLLALVGGGQLPTVKNEIVVSFGVLAPLLTTKAFVLALIVTGAIPNTPVLSRALELLRKWMHSRARIPERFNSIYHALQRNIRAGKPEIRKEAIAWKASLVKSEDFEIIDTSSARYWMSRAIYVRAFIEHLRTRDPRKTVYKRAFESYDAHIKRVDSQLAESETLYINVDGIPPAHISLLRRRLRALCLRLVQICISVVFVAEYSDYRALEKLSALDGDIEEHVHPSPPYDFYLISCIFLFVFAFALIWVSDIYKSGIASITRETFRHSFFGAMMATMMMPVPGVLVAVAKSVFQGVWPYRLPGQARQYLPYVQCAALGYLFAYIVLWISVTGGFTVFETLGNKAIPGFAFIGASFGLVSAICIDASRELWTSFSIRDRVIRVASYCGVAVTITTIGSLIGIGIALALSDAQNVQGPLAFLVFEEFAATAVWVVGGLTILHVTFTLSATKRKIRFHTQRDLKRFVLDQSGIRYEQRADETRLNVLLGEQWSSFSEDLQKALVKGKIASIDGVIFISDSGSRPPIVLPS